MVTLCHNAWLCKWIQICMQIWQSTNSAKAIAPPSAWRGCSRSHVLPTRHLTALCSGFWSSMSFHQGSPEEWQKGKTDQIEGKIHSLISADAHCTHTHTCSMGIPSSALSLLWAALLTPIASFSSSSLSMCKGWLQHVFVKQPACRDTEVV